MPNISKLSLIDPILKDYIKEQCALILEKDLSSSSLRLQGGEMTEQECRTVRAFLKSRAEKIRQLRI
jgi:hypothetical protein